MSEAEKTEITEGTEKTEMEQKADQGQEDPKKKKKKRKWLLFLLILLLLILLSCGGYWLWQYYTVEAPLAAVQKELDAEVGILPGMSEDEIIDRLNRHVAEGRFNASMNGNPVFKNGKEKGNVHIENIPGNRYAFTLSIEVTNVDASRYPDAAKYVGQTVLQTGLLEPGTYLTDKKLDVPLPKGNYDCIATFTAYTSEKDAGGEPQTEVGATAMQIVVTVEE